MSRAIVRDGRLRGWFALALIALLVVVIAVSLAMGRFPLAPTELLSTIASRLGGEPVAAQLDSVVFGLRIPRVMLAVIVGAGLATAGAAFQSLFSNPLATPDTLGVTAGASVGAVIGLLLSLPIMGVQLVSLVFGILSVGLTLLISKRRGGSGGGTSIVMLVLAGVVVAAIANAVLSMLKLVADPNNKLPQITYWLMGSMAGADIENLTFGAPLILLGIITIFLLRWRLNVLALGEDEARAAGMNVRWVRAAIIVAATLITASSVSMCGQVGWVGLLIPHTARMICGSNNRLVVPLSIVLGAVFLVVIDTMARTVSASEIPISVLTAFVGAPVFVILLRRTGGKWS